MGDHVEAREMLIMHIHSLSQFVIAQLVQRLGYRLDDRVLGLDSWWGLGVFLSWPV